MTAIIRAPADQPPFPVELVVQEEDRWRVLSAPAALSPEHSTASEIIAVMADDTLPPTGTLMTAGNTVLAIVHDLEQHPTTSIEIVQVTIGKLIEHCRRRGIRAIASDPLGCVHGELDEGEVLAAFQSLGRETLERIWIVMPVSRRTRRAST